MTAFSVHARLRGLDRAVLAERAATALRKTHDINAACAQLGISRKFLRSLAQEYDFPIQSYQRASTWPQRDDPGQPSDHVNRWLATNYVKARKAASEAMKDRPAPRSTTAPPPAPYDQCLPDEPVETMLPSMPRSRSESVIASVCRKHGISKEALLGPLRAKHICAARHEAAFRLIVEVGMSYPAAGRRLGNRDHTTILHSVRTHAARNPEAAEVFSKFCNDTKEVQEHRRHEAVRMHFDDGKPVSYVARKLGVSRFTVLPWLLDEANARNGRMAA